jgi:nickel superoxide dismutase
MNKIKPPEKVHAHCDGPCGVYDPASARIAAEAALSMTQKLTKLDTSDSGLETKNTINRFVAIKEEQAQLAKKELLILWTDYFKPVHLESYPELHTLFWNAAKLCSTVKTGVSIQKADELLEKIKEIHTIFWATKDRDVPFYTAG